MKIEITRSGGFGGLTRTWSLDVDRSEAEQRWLPLAAEASPNEASVDVPQGEGSSTDVPSTEVPPARTPPTAQRDRFTYRIAIGYTEVYLPEGELDDPWRELIDRARAAAPEQHPGTAGTRGDAPDVDGTDPVQPRDLL